MSEHWPPEWGDPDTEKLAGDGLDTDGLDTDDIRADLAEVTAALASVPLPVLPSAFGARISAAIADEAATRRAPGGASGVPAPARSPSSDGSTDGSATAAGRGAATAPPRRRSRRGSGRRAQEPATLRTPRPRRGLRRLGSAPALGSLAVGLVIAGFGFLIAHASNGSSSSSSAASAAAPFTGAGGVLPSGSVPASAHGQSARSGNPGFVVSDTGTRYEAAALAGQVRAEVAAVGRPYFDITLPTARTPASLPSAAASTSASSSAAGTSSSRPPRALAGCVDSLAHGVRPSLVDRATYAGRPAYVIAVPRQAWVVGVGCTAAKPELIVTIALAGLSGNLCALGSV